MTSTQYCPIFNDYPDVVDVETLCSMLGGISKPTAYKLLHENKIKHFKIGRIFYIPKYHILNYLEIFDMSNVQ